MRILREFRRVSVLAGAITASLASARQAHAFERQWHVGIDGGYAVIFEDGVSGFGGGAHAAYGLSDSFNAMLELDVTRHPGGSATVGSGDGARVFPLDTIASGAVGVAYTIDVARAVPYVGVLAGGYRSSPLFPLSPGGQLALGLDYQLERNWAVGAQIRMHTIFTAQIGTVAYATSFVRLEYLWGF